MAEPVRITDPDVAEDIRTRNWIDGADTSLPEPDPNPEFQREPRDLPLTTWPPRLPRKWFKLPLKDFG